MEVSSCTPEPRNGAAKGDGQGRKSQRRERRRLNEGYRLHDARYKLLQTARCKPQDARRRDASRKLFTALTFSHEAGCKRERLDKLVRDDGHKNRHGRAAELVLHAVDGQRRGEVGRRGERRVGKRRGEGRRGKVWML